MNSLLNIFLDEAKDDKLFADIDNASKSKSTKSKKSDTDDEEPEDDSTDDTSADDSTTDDDTSTEDDSTDDSLDDTGNDDLGGDDDTSTDDSSDTGTDDTTDDTGEDDSTDDLGDGEDSGVDDDTKLKSKVLLKSFVNLYNDIGEIVDRIDSADKYDDKLESITLNRTSNNLKRIKDILFDYIKSIYITKSYEENLYYYHYILNSTKLTKKIFDKIIEIRGKA